MFITIIIIKMPITHFVCYWCYYCPCKSRSKTTTKYRI